MAQVMGLDRAEAVVVDDLVLASLERSLGPQRAREIVADACFEIVERLTRFDLSIAERDAMEAAKLARTIAAIAEEIGLTSLAAAARAASECQRQNADPVAKAATERRLTRTGEASLDALFTIAVEKTGAPPARE